MSTIRSVGASALCLSAFFALATASIAAAMTGNELLKRCQSAVLSFDDKSAFDDDEVVTSTFWCMGYVDGVRHTSAVCRVSHGSCYGDADIDTDQAIRVVVKYLKDHPEKLHLDALGLILEAIDDAFPCVDE